MVYCFHKNQKEVRYGTACQQKSEEISTGAEAVFEIFIGKLESTFDRARRIYRGLDLARLHARRRQREGIAVQRDLVPRRAVFRLSFTSVSCISRHAP